MPRPDIKALGTNYRRIPLMSIGRDIYNDTRLILSKLEQLFPPSPQHPSISSNPGLSKLFEIWAVDGGGFRNAGALIPAEMPLLKDPKFQKDREEYTGFSWTPENVAKGRADALVEMRNTFENIERNFLADGREWIAGTKEPSLTDIEAVWLLHWLRGLPGALPPDVISKTQFPRTFAWVERFDGAAKAAAEKMGKPKTVKWPEVKGIVKGSEFAEVEASADGNDPSGYKKGTVVEVWPTDSGFSHRDRGTLVGLDWREIVIKSKMEDGTEVRVHAPRHGFRIKEVKDGETKL
ncbi:uncharacterized protein LY89DRAFT_685698 [Mollisia scopiformis]|uniref:DUF7962 domain-containing protein n=1 Tax=Mollisia scopiformis TaxID=149040 RepID=A0A194X6P3_MOLSC|nr:uncharacterized protein LY89DRAFT_685698 [Mollisia scopiformis]KUJ15754.1 hypothetical protein LY89DRAFT_685698 [Mollisia scopiformis]